MRRATPREEHEDNGDYEAESSPAKRGVRGPGKVKVATPPPAALPLTMTVSLVNAVPGEEDVTVKIKNTVFMWIGIPCWMDLGLPLGRVFPLS